MLTTNRDLIFHLKCKDWVSPFYIICLCIKSAIPRFKQDYIMMLQWAKLLTQEVLLVHLLQSAINNSQPSCWKLLLWITMHKASRFAWRKQSPVPVPHYSTVRLLLLATVITETQLVLNTNKMERGNWKGFHFPEKDTEQNWVLIQNLGSSLKMYANSQGAYSGLTYDQARLLLCTTDAQNLN